jgi:hypothetical protein
MAACPQKKEMSASEQAPVCRDFTLGNLEPRDEPLNEFVLKSFIAPSVAWLLGGQNCHAAFDRSLQKAPIRPQHNGSHWETAWCVSYMLESWDTLNKSHSFPHLCQDIRDRFTSDNRDSNPAIWLCTEALEQNGGTVHWPGKEYDTAVVSMSLVRLLNQKHIELPHQVRSQIQLRCIQSQLWLRNYAFQHLRNCFSDSEAPAVLEAILYGFTLSAEEQKKIHLQDQKSDEAQFWTCVDVWLSLLEKKLGLSVLTAATIAHSKSGHTTNETPFEKAVIGHDAVRCLCFLAETLIPVESIEDKATLLMRCRRILSQYLKYLESDLRVTRWGENLNRATKLGLYVRAYRCAAGNDNAPHTEVVLGALSLLNTVVFKNGSIFHNTYPTIYFLGSTIELLKWSKASSKLSTLFSESLDVFVDGLLPGRLHSIELLNETINLRHELKIKEFETLEVSKKYDRFRRKTWWWVANAIAVFVAIFIYWKGAPLIPTESDRLIVVSILVCIVVAFPMIMDLHLKKD